MNAQETKPFKIMIVDDDQFLSEMYGLKFTQSGHGVVIAGSGEEALKKLREGAHFDAIALDVVMPKTTGFAVLETIKAEKLGGDPAIIMLTNQGQDTDVDAAMSRGADGYIIKAGVVPSEVVKQVVEVINAHASK